MEREEILHKIKINTNNSGIRLPSKLEFTIMKNTLFIKLSSKIITENMQTDSASFESWAIVLKRWLDEIKDVVIEWEEANTETMTNSERQHYQRFLFRAIRFCEAYKWANISDNNTQFLNQLLLNDEGKNLLNTASKKRDRNYTEEKSLESYTESQLEEFIVSHEATIQNFKLFFNLEKVDNQFPVGVFKNEVSQKTRIFTGGKSAIDIWGINKNKDFCIFELKNSNNKKVGAISEMLFYSYVIQDLTLETIEVDYSDVEFKNIKNIICYLLAPSTHPLIDEKVFEILNHSSSKISFKNAVISQTNNEMEFSLG